MVEFHYAALDVQVLFIQAQCHNAVLFWDTRMKQIYY